jgi:hypothetical protein
MPDCEYKSITTDVNGKQEKISITACKSKNNKDVVTAGKMYVLTSTYESEVQANYLASPQHNMIENNPFSTENSLTQNNPIAIGIQFTQVAIHNKPLIQLKKQNDVEVYQKGDLKEFSVVSHNPNSDLEQIMNAQIQELATSGRISNEQADLLRSVEAIDLDDAIFTMMTNKISDPYVNNYIEMPASHDVNSHIEM